ncbi:MAG: 50S ribosomal protein L30 [Gemmatimonadetes bacterium]|nr:50S ribosomal protein L30 [Gemmatimonadota bacterium]MBL8961260.1 50S ribosomal protein L30 [Gemmatimonadota bacterium]
MPRTFVWHRSRGPQHTPKETAPTGELVKVTQVRSGIGHSWKMRLVLESLGLRHHQDTVIQKDTPQLRGAIKKVRHLVQVSPIKE